MNTILIGNFISLLGCILMVISGLIKEKKKILLVQSFQVALLGIANLVLGAFSGFIAGIVSLVRNLVFTRLESSTKLKLLFIFIQIVLSINPNGMTWVDWMPVIACVSFTWYIDTPSEITLKKIFIMNLTCWAIYDLTYTNYVSFTFDLFSIISNFIGILMIKKTAKEKK